MRQTIADLVSATEKAERAVAGLRAIVDRLRRDHRRPPARRRAPRRRPRRPHPVRRRRDRPHRPHRRDGRRRAPARRARAPEPARRRRARRARAARARVGAPRSPPRRPSPSARNGACSGRARMKLCCDPRSSPGRRAALPRPLLAAEGARCSSTAVDDSAGSTPKARCASRFPQFARQCRDVDPRRHRVDVRRPEGRQEGRQDGRTCRPPGTPVEPRRAAVSPAEKALLERLGERRQELDERQRELETRENLLKAADKKLEARINELKDLEGKRAGRTDGAQAAERGSRPALQEPRHHVRDDEAEGRRAGLRQARHAGAGAGGQRHEPAQDVGDPGRHVARRRPASSPSNSPRAA